LLFLCSFLSFSFFGLRSFRRLGLKALGPRGTVPAQKGISAGNFVCVLARAREVL